MKQQANQGASGMLLGMAAGAALGAVGVMAATQNQRQQWQQSAPGGQQPSYSQGDPDDFSVIDDSDDLPL